MTGGRRPESHAKALGRRSDEENHRQKTAFAGFLRQSQAGSARSNPFILPCGIDLSLKCLSNFLKSLLLP